MRKIEPKLLRITIFKFLIILLPLMLLFSYYPVIRLGSGETMEFELSLPLIWLVVFDVAGIFVLMREGKLFCNLKKKWAWLLLPGFLTISVLWSANVTRGVLTVGILWLIYFAIYIMLNMKNVLNEDEFRKKFWKVFFGSVLIACGWCFLQCVLDLVGVPRECSLMCEGCTYRSFGFPHPNGFAIEPQFMGNLLLAPIIVTAFFVVKKKQHGKDLSSKFLLFCLFVTVATLFLTFSRGAIYSLIVGLMFMSGFYGSKYLVQSRKFKQVDLNAPRGKYLRAMTTIWATVVLAFVFTLNLQGVMSAVSSTNDTYFDGVAKVLNHLSLGIIDIRKTNEVSENSHALSAELTEENLENDEKAFVENSVENSVEENKENSYFDGYVAESTDVRIQMNKKAIKLWASNFRTIMLGVGLGGAGQALYDNGFTGWPKEIVQNQYVSLLLETGLVGIGLLVVTLILAIKTIIKMTPEKTKKTITKNSISLFDGDNREIILTLMATYGVTLLFFAGLPNALQVYLMPVVVMLLL